MRILIQRVSQASVISDGIPTGKIAGGLLLFAGFEDGDDQKDIQYAVRKIVNLRIFDDKDGVMNLSLMDVKGDILLISQFTLHAKTDKGNRPSYIKAARPEIAIPLYNSLLESLSQATGREIQCGVFGADMKVTLINDGPVTIWIDTKE
ncbi:MAG: D-aminoacyl-tRNA deacylase [Bacteroidales bacterium]|jgi:D-tyrosyl-tRNA(Tyr) deacylase|nr:D-aminoacyl-tRNA deacylase [Bacteroidales bacterium]